MKNDAKNGTKDYRMAVLGAAQELIRKSQDKAYSIKYRRDFAWQAHKKIQAVIDDISAS